MATRHSHRKPLSVQVSKPAPEKRIISLGQDHPTDGILEYLRNASPTTLTLFGIKQDGEAADLRRKFADLIEAWIDALAIKRVIAWQQRQPRKVEPPPLPKPKREPPQDEPVTSQCRQTPSEQMISARLFKRWGCKSCHEHTQHYSGGMCRTCYQRWRYRTEDATMELLIESTHEWREGGSHA